METLALSMVRGKTGTFYITATQSDGTPQSLTGKTLWFHAQVGGVRIDKTSASSPPAITITNAAGGLATLEIPPEDTLGLPDVTPAAGTWEGPCELILLDGAKKIPLNGGTLTVTSNVGVP